MRSTWLVWERNSGKKHIFLCPSVNLHTPFSAWGSFSTFLFICLSVHVYLSACLLNCAPPSICSCLFLCLHVWKFVTCTSVNLSVRTTVWMSVSMSACLFIHPSKYLFMTVSLLACLFISLSVSLSSCLLALFIYLVLVQYAGLFPCQFFYLYVCLSVCVFVRSSLGHEEVFRLLGCRFL